jgi:hypothetical protein
MAAMSCAEFARWSVSDDPAERALAEDHAAQCAECAARLAGFDRLAALATDWQAALVEPPPRLTARILRPRVVRGRFAAETRPLWLAAAAMLLLVAGFLAGLGVRPRAAQPRASALLASEALAEAERAELVHAEAITRLEAAAAPVLARAEDPRLGARDAALLLSYRGRLRALDRTLTDVQTFLAGNPYHAQAREVLLTGYIQKKELLRQVVALERGGATT